MKLSSIAQINGLKLHHTAMARGYVSRLGHGVIQEYKGRFGVGLVVLKPRWDTSRYVTIEYWVK